MIVGEGALVSCMDGSLCPVDLLCWDAVCPWGKLMFHGVNEA